MQQLAQQAKTAARSPFWDVFVCLFLSVPSPDESFTPYWVLLLKKTSQNGLRQIKIMIINQILVYHTFKKKALKRALLTHIGLVQNCQKLNSAKRLNCNALMWISVNTIFVFIWIKRVSSLSNNASDTFGVYLNEYVHTCRWNCWNGAENTWPYWY